jgi:hypothetical protein
MSHSFNLKSEVMLEHLILQGAVEVSGIDKNTGEMIYSITNKLKEVSPEMYSYMEKDFRQRMFEMIDQGPTIMQWRLVV